jgi:hypothetical protein
MVTILYGINFIMGLIRTTNIRYRGRAQEDLSCLDRCALQGGRGGREAMVRPIYFVDKLSDPRDEAVLEIKLLCISAICL